MKIPLSQIEIDDKFYPRTVPDWMTVQRYSDAMESGIAFPPITVVKTSGHYLLLDGRHRFEATRKLDHERIYAVVKQVPKKQWFQIALQMNMTNGKPLSMQERLTGANRLLDEGLSRATVAKLVHIPTEKLTKYLIDRAIKTPSGAEFILKGTLKEASVKPKTPNEQSTLTVSSPHTLFVQLQQILDNNLLDVDDEKTMVLAARVSKLLVAYLRRK